MTERRTPILDRVTLPADSRTLTDAQLKQLADDLRRETIDAVSVTGGHLGAGLGVVELTVAIHNVFETPRDKVIWDVGHQAYPHKILTGRRDRIRTLRQAGGLSGFTRRAESEYDPFGAAHSSTSISAGLGMAVARDLKGDDFNVVAVIGDGAMSAGMACEAMNNAGSQKSRMIVVLNDNDMSIAPPVGALSAHLSQLISSKPYRSLRELAKQIAQHLPKPMEETARRAEEFARGMVTGGTLFEELGFYYVGPVDGHNLDHLLPVLRNIRDMKRDRPVLLHVVTEKGRGHPFGVQAADKYHAVPKFDVVTGEVKKPVSNAPSYTAVFADSLIKEAEADDRIVAVTAAMPSGTGLDKFAKAFPTRSFDVGIAEQHAVTFAAGMACEGLKPFVAIYSTFMQRAYDQIIHDICIQNLPVTFCLDRAGIVGADGATHTGMFDIAFMRNLPNMTVMAPKDEAELKNMLATSGTINGPVCIRYPRGNGYGVDISSSSVLPVGKAEVMTEGGDGLVIAVGSRVRDTLAAVETLRKEDGREMTLLNLRFVKPLDIESILLHLKPGKALIIIEEGVAQGGIGQEIATVALSSGWSGPFMHIAMPDQFPAHGTQVEILRDLELDAEGILKQLRNH